MKLLAFAQARQTFGFSEKEIEIEILPGETARSLLTRIAPAISLDGLRVAVDQTFVEWDTQLTGAREMAILPPVSGG